MSPGGAGAVAGARVAAAFVLLVVAGCGGRGGAGKVAATYVGADACAPCHAKETALWRDSDHARAMDVAADSTVLGDFSGVAFRYAGTTSTFFRRDGGFWVRTDGPDGALQEYRIDYVFGFEPLQQYLIRFPDGRIQALNICWDTRPRDKGGQRWFHLYPDESITHDDILHWTGPLQNWDYMCAECHSTDVRRGFDLAAMRWSTTWSEIDVSCEACHGPGSAHVAWGEAAKKGRAPRDPRMALAFTFKGASRGEWVRDSGYAVARRATPLPSRIELETCARCHARRSEAWTPDEFGVPIAQTHRISWLEDPLYFADGQIRDEVYEYASFQQGWMHQVGVTCSDCHDPHSGRNHDRGNALCARCHAPGVYDTKRHHFHPGTDAAGTRCVECHMPARDYMVVDRRHEHTFRNPRPDLTVATGVPNTCNADGCHRDRSAKWAADRVVKWYGAKRHPRQDFTFALDAGRRWALGADSLLLRVAGDAATPGIVRASALALLDRYPSPGALELVRRAVSDPDPQVRRAAASLLGLAEPAERLRLGLTLLEDSVRTVRLDAVSVTAAASRAVVLTPSQRRILEQAVGEYRSSQWMNPDRAESHVNLGALDALLGRPEAADSAYARAIALRPGFDAAWIDLADLRREQGRELEAERTLREAIGRIPGSGAVHHALGLSLARQRRGPEALAELAQAARLAPEEPRFAYVHAVALHDAGRAADARRELDRLLGRYPGHRESLQAAIAYALEAGDFAAARRWGERLARAAPWDAETRALVERLAAGGD